MMEGNTKKKIVDIDGYIHVINGKVICFNQDVYDLNNPDDVKSLFELLERLFSSPHLKPIYGDQTMYYFEPDSDVDGIYLGMGDINVFLSNFSEDVQKKCRLAILKHKNQIIDIDGYAHVINGKVICFKSDVYDLHNLKHVEELLYLSLRMSSDDDDDKFYYGGYGDNTILFLDRNPDNLVELTETMGSLRYMPEDYRRKIEGVLYENK